MIIKNNPQKYLEEIIRPNLEKMEDQIIIGFLERSKLKQNKTIYKSNLINDNKDSFFDTLLRKTEEIHSLAGRYTHPQEYAFNDNLPEAEFNFDYGKNPIRYVNFDLNEKIYDLYLNSLETICLEGEDNEFGSTALLDIVNLQNLSKRIHYGFHVAEAKFLTDKTGYSKLIENRDIGGIALKLRNKDVEEKIIQRVAEKAIKFDVNPIFIQNLYLGEIIPLTIDAEIKYFLDKNEK